MPVRSPTLPPATHTNVWVLGQHTLTVVDPASPWADEQDRLREALDGMGRVERIVLTHHHHDHVQGAEALAEATGAPILAHPETVARLAFDVLPLGDRFTTDTGDVVVRFTPGHAPGHVALQAPSGHLVAGDLVAGTGTILIEPDDDGHLGTYLASLAAMRDLHPVALLPAHGPVLDDAVHTLDTYIAHRHMRTDQIRRALAPLASATPTELAPRVYVDLDPRLHPLAARQITAHLVWLAEQGEVEARDGRWFRT
ncbi:MAG: MBL fold metallo-hydrolase [Alphaproteobacteria bacterium]|nr:MBL fold metallo-hydrolase [Alphaproteobacteria bacterium]MCB9692031.1 MBL fold metallo-hydrolase [Alphaproteobacteria bacterium]